MSEPKMVTFVVEAAENATELFLIDGSFQLVKKGIGKDTFTVPPGIYKLKVRSGKTAIEKMLLVRDGMAPVKIDPITITSSMPLANSSKTHGFHMSAAELVALTPNVPPHGQGSAVIIVARQWTAPNPPEPLKQIRNPARGLTLHDHAGALLVDIEHETSVTTTFDPCVAVHVEVDPGEYRLRLAYGDGRRVEQSLITCNGWQTHVYLLLDNNPNDDLARVDLINGAITMRRPVEGFKPSDEKLRMEEVVRGAFADGRKILSDAVRAEITSPTTSPILALLGAHLLIRETKDDKAKVREDPDDSELTVDNRPQVRTIVENLRVMIGGHPDVEAIAIGAGNPDPNFAFKSPPMFRASWRLLLKASVERPQLIPVDSFLARVAERVWGEGPWLLWIDPEYDELVDRSALWRAKARELLSSRAEETGGQMKPGVTVAISALPGILLPVTTEPVEPATSKIKALFTSRVRTPFPNSQQDLERLRHRTSIDADMRLGPLTDDERRGLVKQLGIPANVIESWLGQIKK